MNIFWKCSIQLVSWTQRYSAWRPTQSQPCPHSSPHTPRWSGTQRRSRALNIALNIAINIRLNIAGHVTQVRI